MSIIVLARNPYALFQVNNTVSYKDKYSLGASFFIERIKSLSLNAGVKLADRFELMANYEIPARPKAGYSHSPKHYAELSTRFTF